MTLGPRSMNDPDNPFFGGASGGGLGGEVKIQLVLQKRLERQAGGRHSDSKLSALRGDKSLRPSPRNEIPVVLRTDQDY